MIGQKLFSKNKNENQTAANNQSVPNAPAPSIPQSQPVAPQAQSAPLEFNKPKPVTKPEASVPMSKLILVSLISVLVTAGVMTGIYFLFIAPRDEDQGELVVIDDNEPVYDGTETVEEAIKEYDERLSESTDESETLSLTISKASFYSLQEEYNSAIETLNTIDISKLDVFDQYRVYYQYVEAYQGLGDTANAEHYQQLLDDANNRAFEEAE